MTCWRMIVYVMFCLKMAVATMIEIGGRSYYLCVDGDDQELLLMRKLDQVRSQNWVLVTMGICAGDW